MVVTGMGKNNLQMSEISGRRITQHKRFVFYGTHPNFYFAKTSFKLRTLYEIPKHVLEILKNEEYNIIEG